MIHSSVVFASIASIILVQTYATQPSNQEISQWNHDSREIGDNDEEQNPSIACILFGNVICHVQCYLAIDIYYYEINTVGHCDNNQSCICHYEVNRYLPNNWDLKFDADYVYWAIARNEALFNHVYNLFTQPFKTGKELKQILHPYLSPYQYSKLEIDDSTLAHEFIEDGKINKELVRKYVSDRLRPVFISDSKYKFYVNYEQNFRNALKNIRNQGTLYNIAFEIRVMENKKLEGIFHEHLTKNGLKQPDVKFDEIKSLEAVLYHTVTNEVIKQRDQMGADPVVGKAVHSALNSDDD